MHGFPLDTAREVMFELLGKLRPESFNILFFSGGFHRAVAVAPPATPANLQRAMDMMKAYDGGGTELVPALKTAFGMPRTRMPRAASRWSLTAISAPGARLPRPDPAKPERNQPVRLRHRLVGEPLPDRAWLCWRGRTLHVITGSNEAAGVGERFRRYVEAPLMKPHQGAGARRGAV